MKTQTFLIRCEYPDGDCIQTQEFIENIEEYFAANIMDGERGRLVVKPVYQPKRDPLYAVPEEIKEMVSLEVEFSNFVSLVRRMREAQIEKDESDQGYRTIPHICILEKKDRLESQVDEYLKKMKV